MFIKKMTHYLEELIALIKAFVKEIRSLEILLSKEADAISQSDLISIEEITGEKVLLSQQMEAMVQAIRNLEKQMKSEFVGIESDSKASLQLNLDEFIKFIDHLLVGCSHSNILNLRNDLDKEMKTLIFERKSVFPRVESNAYMIKKLLHYHRETYAFWQSVAGESESTYSQSGKSKTVPQRSILSVRT